MEFHATETYNGAIDDVVSILLSRELAEQRASLVDLELVRFDSAPGRATLVGRVGEGSRAARFWKGEATVTASDIDGDPRVISYNVSVPGAPVKIELRTALSSEGESTEAAFEGEVKVTIPFVGKAAEKKAVSSLPQLLARDAKIVNSLL